MIKLSILIPSIPEREKQLEALIFSLNSKKTDQVEIITDCAPKQDMSIGLKRNNLYLKASGEYSVQIDDDDSVPDYFIEECLNNLGSDCIGYKEHCLINGQVQDSIISIKNKKWYSIEKKHFRTPHFKTPILTNICRKVGVKDMRWGEDHDFAKRIMPLLNTEKFIDKIMYYYTANTLTKTQHKERYGL